MELRLGRVLNARLQSALDVSHRGRRRALAYPLSLRYAEDARPIPVAGFGDFRCCCEHSVPARLEYDKGPI
ncbi:Beta-1,4-galactosyltransferase 5 [Frankliniella fusca]|uniref:Beta-1,4-galactosyltransferase 5 n=1 Tax=Frankliniella fusca TaxID=407009 RepID=A0AAE1GYW7_9NEOP|nr:Beta-1,4-galactosyltransferase 5 [Frankliniella fusca]